MERVSIFVDAGNFYHLVLKKLNLHELDFDFDGLASFLYRPRTRYRLDTKTPEEKS